MADQADLDLERRLALREDNNQEAMILFAAAMSALFGLVLLYHLLSCPAVKEKTRRLPLLGPAVWASRKARNVLLAKFPFVPSVGHLFVMVPYVGINLVITFIKFDNDNLPLKSNVASRTGWMTISNTLIVMFLALKNTPLALLGSWSYDRLNVFHRVAGCATVIFAIVHGSSYTSVLYEEDFMFLLRAPEQICGITAGFCLLCIGITGVVVRRWWYEAFYYLHLFFWVAAIILIGFHQPEASLKAIYITCFAAGIWTLDRLFRLGRLAVNGTNNSVQLIPLASGGTRLIFAKRLPGDVMAKHAFLWIPKIRALQTHPFTLVATDPLEMVVAAQKGFTRALYEYATERPGVTLPCSVEGPYGHLPNPKHYDRILFVAGGSGATFTVGSALKMLTSIGSDQKAFTFVWLVKHDSHVTWFSEYLNLLRNDARVSVHVYVTRPSDATPARGLDKKPSATSASSDNDKTVPTTPNSEKVHDEKDVIILPKTDLEQDVEKDAISAPARSPVLAAAVEDAAAAAFPVTYGRPMIPALIKAEVDGAHSDESLLVMACGPGGLMDSVRNAVAENVRVDGPGIELHSEKFA